MLGDTVLLILFSDQLLLAASSVGIGWKEPVISSDNVVVGEFKEQQKKVSQLEVLLRSLRSITYAEELTSMSL